MNVFLSWSGTKSNQAAEAFHQCLKYVFQNRVQIYLSSDMEKGVRWEAALNEHLEKAEFGILCVTQANVSAPWLMYEAGVLHKTAGEGFVAPFLLDINPSELSGPLTRFQLTVFKEEDLKRLFSRVNQRLPEESRIADKEIFEGLFQMVYNAHLKKLLTDALHAPDDAKSATQKLLELCKDNQTLLRDVLFELQTRCT